MAYAESTLSGTFGGSYRVWVNSIRTHDGSAADNSEDWRVEGGLNKIATGTSAYNGYNQASYTLQLGLNGVASSGNYNYNFSSGQTGTVLAWGTGATKVYRNSAGVGYGFQSRMDINLANSAIGSGWVTSNDSVQTKYRQATLTVAPNFNDEANPVINYSNPAGNSVTTLTAAIYDTSGTTALASYRNVSKTGSSYTFTLTDPERDALRAHTTTSNTKSIRFYLRTNVSGEIFHSYLTRTLTIVNGAPTFADFIFEDTNATTVAVTGSDQILVQGKSTLEVTVPVADKATANKSATMSSYNVTIGAYSQNSAWSNVADVVQGVGIVSDVSGVQSLGVRAVDSRGNSTTVSKNVTVLPYASPGFYNNLRVSYANDFDIDDGLTVNLLNDEAIGSVSPMTLSGTDINAVPSPSGLRFDIAKDTGAYTGTWTNIAFTQEATTGYIKVDPEVLATAIEAKINGMTADNTVRWHVLFGITDELETQYFTATIDVGRPFFRIGADGRLYYKEIEFFETFSGKSDFYYPSLQAYSLTGANWVRTYAGGYIGSWGILYNPGGADGDSWSMEVYLPAGIYNFVFYLFGSTTTVKVDININGTNFISAYDTYNAGGNIEKIVTLSSVGVLDGATYTITGTTNGRNAANTTNWINGLLAIKAQRTGDL